LSQQTKLFVPTQLFILPISSPKSLQSDKAKFTKNQENEICPLCHSDTEDTEHFILICPSLKSVRDRHLSVLRKYVANNFGNDIFNKIKNERLTIQFLLDSSSVKLRHIVKFKTENLRDIENMTRTLCFGMHNTTIKLIEEQMSREYTVLLYKY